MITRTGRLAGFLIAEDDRLPWQAYQLDKHTRTIVCGEYDAVRWVLWQRAWKEVVRRELELTLREFAQRVGVEYTDQQHDTTR